MLGVTCEFFVTVSFDFGEWTPSAGWIWTETWFRFLFVSNLISQNISLDLVNRKMCPKRDLEWTSQFPQFIWSSDQFIGKDVSLLKKLKSKHLCTEWCSITIKKKLFLVIFHRSLYNTNRSLQHFRRYMMVMKVHTKLILTYLSIAPLFFSNQVLRIQEGLSTNIIRFFKEMPKVWSLQICHFSTF